MTVATEMLPLIFDVKSGWVDSSTWIQHGAYSLGRDYFTHQPLPTLGGAAILRVDDKRCQALTITQAELEDYAQQFLVLMRIWKGMVADGQIQNRDTYRLTIDGEEVLFPRVTSVLKAVLNKQKLNDWRLRKAVEATLKECQRQGLDRIVQLHDQGLFDAEAAAKAHMESRGGQGTAIHKCISAYLLGKPVEIDPANVWLTTAYGRFTTWATKHNFKLVGDLTERKIYSSEHGFAGTYDAIATAEGL